MGSGYPSLDLSDREFDRISTTVQDLAGIRLPPGKETLVKSRLSKRLRALGLADFEAYLRFLDEDGTGSELAEMVDALTTNKTSFFRESVHFDHFAGELEAGQRTPLRVWSAGCSTGEEPYTLAMMIREHGSSLTDARILGTDISGRALGVARHGEYTEAGLAGVPEAFRRRYFQKTVDGHLRINAELRSLVTFARLNLLGDWPMRGPFDVIFCRNVMIYFDRDVRERLVRRFHGLLRPGGHLYVGHSESLTGLEHSFDYVRPAVYRR